MVLLGVAGAAFTSGAYLTKLKIDISQSREERQHQQQMVVEQALEVLRRRIRWNNEMRTRLLERRGINDTPQEVKDTFQSLIDELNQGERALQRALNDTLER